MMQTLFSPNGRIGSREFIRAGFVLILIGAALNLAKLVNPVMGSLLGLLAILLLYPWTCIWVKRLHDGNKSGATVFLYIFLYLALLFVGMIITIMMFGGAEFMELVNAKMADEISQAEYFEQSQLMGQKLVLPSAISGILVSVATLFIGDKTIGSDPDDNQYGPA